MADTKPKLSRRTPLRYEDLSSRILQAVIDHWNLHHMPVSEGVINRKWFRYFQTSKVTCNEVRLGLIGDKKIMALTNKALFYFWMPFEAWTDLSIGEQRFIIGKMEENRSGPKRRITMSADEFTQTPMGEYE